MKSPLVILGCLIVIAAAWFYTPQAADTKWVKIKKPFVNVYKFLDPQSTILKQAKKGDYFELVYEGTSWYQVKIQDNVGWLEKRSAILVNSPNATIFSVPMETLVLFFFLLLGTFAGVSFFIYRQKSVDI
jgi:uncharacterized protein YgiM (DUF1202 family)